MMIIRTKVLNDNRISNNRYDYTAIEGLIALTGFLISLIGRVNGCIPYGASLFH
jgi:hypothetical protein